MAFTKITASGIGSTETVTLDGLSVINDGSFGGNVSVGGTLTYEDVTNIDSVGLITARAGVVVGSGITLSKDGDIFATGITTVSGNVKVGTGVTLSPDGDAFFTGVCTATSFSGDGSNLTGISAGTSLSGSTNNTVTTVTGANAIQGEANLKYDDTHLQVGGQSNLGSHSATITLSNRGSSARSAVEIEGNTANCHAALDFRNNGTLVSALNSRGSDRLQFCTGSSGNVKAEVTGDNFEITDGDLIIGTAGHGIDFSAQTHGTAASGVTVNAELLDHYEEGTFQPLLKSLSGSTESSFYNQDTKQGNYLILGNRIWVTGRIHWNGGSSGSGSLILTNLPYTPTSGGANEVPITVGYRSGFNYANVAGYLVQGTNRFMIQYFDSNGSYNISPGATDSSGHFYFAMNYQI